MAEAMTFLPRPELLTLEEIAIIVDRFIARGVRKVRLTGGEPLARRGLASLAQRIGEHLADGLLDELTLTTNGVRLKDHAGALAEAGMRRVNVSLDTLIPDKFRHVTRWGDLSRTLEGISAAREAGMRVKINMVALKGVNEDEIVPMLKWCGQHGHDLTLIETMPLGAVEDERTDHYLPLDAVRARLEEAYTLLPSTSGSGGPARYFDVKETGGRLGLITPLTHNFCETCNRVRLAADGKLYMCLGHEDHVDLRQAYRQGGIEELDLQLDAALRHKPLRHHFEIAAGAPAMSIQRHMSVTGG
jgi:cyclic pyranopterin phosphate synthase